MQDSAYIIFIAFACIWILIGAAAVIALLKSNNQELRFGTWGLIVAIPIIVPFIFVLVYQVARPFIGQHFL
jgi:predicted neutral ceramidase superfamily lipid hydrolase